MKAKEMADRYNADPSDLTVLLLIKDIMLETRDLMIQRNTVKNGNIRAVLREQEDKWIAFTRRCKLVSPELFRKELARNVPEAIPYLPKRTSYA